MGACYIIGEILAAIAYMPNSVLKWIVWEGSRIRGWVKSWEWLKKWETISARLQWLDKNVKAWPKDWLEHNPTEVAPDLFVIRCPREPMFSSLGRRGTLTTLAASTLAAVLAGCSIFFLAHRDAGSTF